MKKKGQLVEAVLFFRERGICKEMLYPEFEAVLDGVVNLPEFSGQQMEAVYLLIDPKLLVRAAVFFYLDFHDDGAADTGWNVPLRNLAERGGRGPDLGAGPIRLVCRSQCPMAWHQMHLWDPELTGKKNHLLEIRDRIKRNALGLLIEEEPQALSPDRLQIAAEDRWYSSGPSFDVPRQPFVEQAASPMSGIPEYMEQKLSQLKREGEEAQAKLTAEIEQLKQRLVQERDRANKLQKEHEAQSESFRRIRDEMGQQVRDSERKGQVGLEAMRARFEQEAQARIAAMADEFEKRLAQVREEVAERDKRLAEAGAEIGRLNSRCAELRESSGERMLESLAGLGMVFVVYHPGAGQLTVPLEDIAKYQQSPLAYAASKCSVTPEHYQQWLEHYMRPTCEAKMLDGSRCAIPVDRVDVPARFSPGVSNCCSRHQGRSESALRTGS